jgi:hypothetical protein
MYGRFALSADTGNLEKLLPELTELRWGLIPSWAKDENIGNRIINARCEILSEKTGFTPINQTQTMPRAYHGLLRVAKNYRQKKQTTVLHKSKR